MWLLIIIAGLVAAALVTWAVRTQLKSWRRLCRELDGIVHAARRNEADLATQNGLEQNLAMLRGALFGFGPPRRREQICTSGYT